MRRSLEIRLASALFIILLGSFGLIRAQLLSVAAEQTTPPCSCCDYSDLEFLDVKVLEGEERMKAVAVALSSQDYKNLKQVLLEMGYTPSIDRAAAQIIEMTVSGTDYEVLTVSVPFDGETDLSAGIVFLVSEEHSIAVAFLGDTKEETLSYVEFSLDGKIMDVPIESLVKGGGGVQPLMEECDYNSDCYYLYGDGWCCNEVGMCEPCEEPGEPFPPPSGCKVMNDNCWNYNISLCLASFYICLAFCNPPPFCYVGCLALYFVCYADVYYDCCLEWW